MTIVNLTPHPIVLGDRTIEPDGRLPRVAEVSTPTGDADGIPVVTISLGEVTGLPEPEPGTWHVVSRMTAEAAPHRRDLLIPYDLVRDEAGRVVGCRALGQVPAPATSPDARERLRANLLQDGDLQQMGEFDLGRKLIEVDKAAREVLAETER